MMSSPVRPEPMPAPPATVIPPAVRSPLQRGFAAMTPRAVAIVVAIAVAYALSEQYPDLVAALGNGRLLAFFRQAFTEIAVYAAMAVTMFACVAPVLERAPARGAARGLALAGAVIVAATIGSAGIVAAIHAIGGSSSWRSTLAAYWFRFWVQFAAICAVLTVVAELHRRALSGLAAAHAADLDRIALEREMSAAQLQVLQAQIEPHFLFNTLANVRWLCEGDLAGGRRMLDNLMRYLQVALPSMRDSRSTVGREAALIEAYLQLQQIRMGRRLRFDIDIADALRPLPMPPMMLLTLVENAIKHGLTPMLDGGSVRVDARRIDERLVLRVADDGRGVGVETSGAGTGLANTRARLTAEFGTAASLTLAANVPRGIVATIVVPVAEHVDLAATP